MPADPTTQDPSLMHNIQNPQNTAQSGDWLRDALDTDVRSYAAQQFDRAGVPTEVGNTPAWTDFFKARLATPARANPYDLNLGNQSRDQYAQALEALHNGPSVAALQATKAGQQLASQIGGGVAGSSGVNQILASQAGANGAGELAGNVGANALSEFMNRQGAYGQGLGAMRGQDLGQMQDFTSSGLKQRAQDDALKQFYAGQAADLTAANQAQAIEIAKLLRSLELAKDQKNWNTVATAANTAGTAAKLLGA